ncbi:MAG: ribonuclease P protein component [Thermaerobacter sp.]|nr:ribonuclease P protein component [Thermaerobacter sp.]
MRYVGLKRRADFGRVFKQGQTYGDRYLVLFVLYTGGAGSRVGFAAQRNAGTAVKRNRIRRRLRSVYREFAVQVDCQHDIVILGKRTVLDVAWPRLVHSLERLLRKSGCLGGTRAGGG